MEAQKVFIGEVAQYLPVERRVMREAAELANLAGKMIASAKVQVEYFALRKESPRIKFLEAAE